LNNKTKCKYCRLCGGEFEGEKRMEHLIEKHGMPAPASRMMKQYRISRLFSKNPVDWSNQIEFYIGGKKWVER